RNIANVIADSDLGCPAMVGVIRTPARHERAVALGKKNVGVRGHCRRDRRQKTQIEEHYCQYDFPSYSFTIFSTGVSRAHTRARSKASVTFRPRVIASRLQSPSDRPCKVVTRRSFKAPLLNLLGGDQLHVPIAEQIVRRTTRVALRRNLTVKCIPNQR